MLGALGIYGIFRRPEVLQALNPAWAVQFFVVHPEIGVAILGAVVLTLTGAEALYADMGHFGRKPIARAWFILVLLGLVLNYFGQGDLILESLETVRNPFYLLAPGWTLLPMVALSTLATIIASQAVIRRFLPHSPGHPAWVCPSHVYTAHLQPGAGTDLHQHG